MLGGRQVACCQRSTLPSKPPALANRGGGLKSIIQRPTRTPSFEPLGLGRRGRLARIAGDGVVVQMRDMGVVEQVVDKELRMRVDAQVPGRQRPFFARRARADRRFSICRRARDRPSRSRPRSISRPPDRRALSRPPAPCPARESRRTGPWYRRSGRDSRSAGDRPPPRPATTAPRDDSSGPRAPPACRPAAEQHHLLAEEGARDRLSGKVLRPDRCIPAVLREHCSLGSS